MHSKSPPHIVGAGLIPALLAATVLSACAPPVQNSSTLVNTKSSRSVSETSENSTSDTPTLLPVGALKRNFELRQTVTITWKASDNAKAQKRSFEAVLQKTKTMLCLLGLGPMQTVGFRVCLEADNTGIQRVTVMNRTGQTLPFSPSYILQDIQRTYYPWSALNRMAHKQHTTSAGLPKQRTFPDGTTITYQGLVPKDDGLLPTEVTIQHLARPSGGNGARYTVVIQTQQ